MLFEFDERKSQSNKKKHGIDFAEAQELWDDPELLEIPLKSFDEPRTLLIGLINGKHWSAIITHRQERTRIISVRRSRIEERELYES
ncbi:MAG: BrnT family toxin [Elusimicrobiota bacterium]